MAADHFCLKWNNFQSSIITAFESLQTTEDLADVTLTCEGLNVKAHKIILSAFSSYFRTVFKENPCPHPIVILKDVLYADLLAVINFMYHGEVLILKDQLPSFLQTAEILQVSGLVGCGNFHIKNVTSQKHNKMQKPVKMMEAIDPVTKKTKHFKKSKSNNSSPIHIIEPNTLKNVLSKPKQPIEAISVDKIKMEIEEDKVLENTESEKNFSSSLEGNAEFSQPSILERSLMSLPPGKQVVTYSEQSNILQLTTDLSRNIHIPEKPPELHETVKHQLEPFIEMSYVDKNDEKTKSFEIDSHGNPKDLVNLHDVPHHSSQCGTCPHCGKIYSNQSALKYHVRLVHSDLTNMYCCHLCPEAFDYRDGYKRHMVDVHNVRN